MTHDILALHRPAGRTVNPVNRLQTGFGSNALLWLAIWSLVLIAWMPWRWDEGYGALPLVEDRIAIASLTLLAAAGGLFVRRWYWPFAVAGAWIALVGATQLWMVYRLGMEPYLERRRVLTPMFVKHDIWSDYRHEFGSTDLVTLVLAGAALPVAGAIVAVAIVRFAAHGSSPFDNRAVLALGILGGASFHGIVEMTSVDRLGAALLAIPAAMIAGALCRRWRCVLGMPIAFICGGLLALEIRLLNHGIEADWRQNVVQGIVDGQWSRTHRTLGDDLGAVSGTAAYVVLPAGLVGLAAASLAVHVVRSWRRQPRVTAPSLQHAGAPSASERSDGAPRSPAPHDH